MRPMILAAAIALAAGVAQAESDDHLLDFGWMTDAQKAKAQEAHAALEAAEAEMCAVMVDTYAEHASKIHGDGKSLPAEEVAFMKRRCAAEAFAAHVEQSVMLHDVIHAEVHAGGHDDH